MTDDAPFRWMTSQLHNEGHLVAARLPAGTRVTAVFVDEPGRERDLTDSFCDLVLFGLAARARRVEGMPSVEVVDVGEVSFTGPTDGAGVVYLHPLSGTGLEVDLADALTLCSEGVADQVTAGVAHDLAAGWETPGG